MAAVREFDLPVSPDGILLCVPESPLDIQLVRRLLPIRMFSPHFIAIIGYSFGRNGETYDDSVSLDCFQHAFRGFQGNIYVVNPDPDDLRDMLAETFRPKSVFGIRAYWNLLAHAFMETLSDPNGLRPLNYVYEQMLDMFGSDVAFPLA
jgi:hypothetical protein